MGYFSKSGFLSGLALCQASTNLNAKILLHSLAYITGREALRLSFFCKLMGSRNSFTYYPDDHDPKKRQQPKQKNMDNSKFSFKHFIF